MSTMSIEDFILIAVFGIISCLLIISIEQICISSIRKRGIRFRAFLCIALITEIIIIFIHYFSLFTTTINAIWVTTNAIFWFSMFTLSFVVHKLVPAPKLYAKEKLSQNLNRIWKFISILHFLWLTVCCLAFFITKDGIYYESIYNFGFLSYLIIGSVLLIIISYNVRLTIKDTMKKMDVSSVNNFQDYIYNNDDQSSDTANSANSSSNGNGNGEGGHKQSKSKKKKKHHHHKSKVSESQAKVLSPIDEMNEKPGYDFARKNQGQNGGHNPRLSSVTSNNLVEPMNQMLQLSKAKYVLTLSILVSVGVGLIALMALYWSIVSFIKAGHENLILFGTYNNQTFFWFHYVFIVLLYIAAMIYHWKPFHQRSKYSLCVRLKRGCCSKGKLKGFRKKRVYSVSALSANGNSKNTPMVNRNSNKSEPFNAENGYHKDEEEVITVEIQANNPPTSPGREYAEDEMDEEVMSPAVQSPDLLEPAKNLRDLISYTNQGSNQLSINQMKLSLNKINSKGNVIGKRGKSKPKKLSDEQKNKGYSTPIDKMEKRTEIVNKLDLKNNITELPKFDDNITDYSDSDDEKYHRRRQDSDSFDPKDLLTRTTAKWRNVELATTIFAPTNGGHQSQATEELAEDIVEELMYLEEEAAKPKVNVVVFEFGHVICTNISKLHEKMVTYVETMTKTQKELCFGGEDRLEMLRNFFKDLSQKKDQEIKTFIIADEQSKMLVKLLNDTNLLKYFVSKNPKKPSKLLSHVIGWDHKIAKQADGKKHLILLKLLQFLQKSHDELLYVGNDKEIIGHLDNIKCCKTFYCETKGLTHDALRKIDKKYFR